MAPSMSLCRATGKPATGLTSSRRRSTTRRTVAAHATPDDKPNAALLTLSAGALLAQSGVVDPAAAAQLAPSADHGVLASQQITTSKSNKFTSTTAPSVISDLADLNADVRDLSKNYRDPAGAIQQDKFADKVQSGTSGMGSSDLGDSIKSGLKDAKKKATDAVSALPTPAVGDLADLNADVRGAAKNYRDPAGAIQQDKFADKVSSGPSLGKKDLGESVKSGAKKAQRKAEKAFSAVPSHPLADLADLNADVRGDAADYRDPAGAVQQDTAADAVKSKVGNLSASKVSTPSAKRAGQKVLSNVTQTRREIGVKAGYGPSGSRVRDSTGKLINADDVRGTNPSIGNARLSQPLVRDSLGVKRVGSKNQTGAAGGSDSQGVVKPLKEVVDRVAN